MLYLKEVQELIKFEQKHFSQDKEKSIRLTLISNNLKKLGHNDTEKYLRNINDLLNNLTDGESISIINKFKKDIQREFELKMQRNTI